MSQAPFSTTFITSTMAFSGILHTGHIGSPDGQFVFGIPDKKKPYQGNLLGNIRIRYRHQDFASLFVRDPYHIREFRLIDKGDYVTHDAEIARNQRTIQRTSI